MIDKQRLAEKCSTWNIALTGTQLDQLDAFAEILVDYNQKVNLTAITDPEGIEDKHFLDSLLFASQPEVAGRMVDVGAGAGFPGIVTKIFKPELQLTLMEPTGKRVEFLKYACAQLGLTGVEFAKERAEEAARKGWREQFDLASARAVAALPNELSGRVFCCVVHWAQNARFSTLSRENVENKTHALCERGVYPCLNAENRQAKFIPCPSTRSGPRRFRPGKSSMSRSWPRWP